MTQHEPESPADVRRPLIGPPPKRRNVVVVLTLLVVGIGLSLWAIAGGPSTLGDHRVAIALESPTTVPSADLASLVARGSRLQQLNCVGCHASDRRLVGPSYADILKQYRDAPDRIASLAAATLHPSPGFAYYPPGPTQSALTHGDRRAIAAWMLDLETKPN